MPAAPVVAPKASDDMTGSVGFGVGVGSGTGTTSLVTTDNTVAIKYWMSDAMALVPRLTFTMAKSKTPRPMPPRQVGSSILKSWPRSCCSRAHPLAWPQALGSASI